MYHWYLYDRSGFDHVPECAVSLVPTMGVPEIVGFVVALSRPGATASVFSDVELALSYAVLAAVTRTVI